MPQNWLAERLGVSPSYHETLEKFMIVCDFFMIFMIIGEYPESITQYVVGMIAITTK